MAKGIFANVMKRWGDYSGLFEWAQCNHKGSRKRDRKITVRNMTMEAQEQRGMIKCYIAGSEDGTTECG